MSLFKVREWWQTQAGHSEEFDVHNLCIANVDNDHSGVAKIITGSLQGNLRIYLPTDRENRAEDLLLEQQLEGGAILALAVGRFSMSGGLCLAVLHPRKFIVYSCVSQGTAYLQLNRLYEHWLEHTAANMAYGPFGGSTMTEHICVQSYDGQLSFYEAESLSFSRYLPNFLVPGPLCYAEGPDAFITCNAALELECYRFSVLAAAGGEKALTTADGLGMAPMPSAATTSKRLQATWRLVLGEAAVDIRVGRFTQNLQSSQCDIVVLGEHHVFVVSSGGQITFQKRLEYHPAACVMYPVPGAKTPGGADNLLVATHTKALLVYRGAQLVWAARASTQPCALAVADVGGLHGAIVSLSDSGLLSVCYLGTDPLLNPVALNDAKELDYDAIAREHRTLAAIIREHGGSGGAGAPVVEAPERLVIRAQVPMRLGGSPLAHITAAGGVGGMSGELDDDGNDDILSSGGAGVRPGSTAPKVLTIKLYIATQSGTLLADGGVGLTIRPPAPLTAETEFLQVPAVSSSASDPTVIPLTLAVHQVKPSARASSSGGGASRNGPAAAHGDAATASVDPSLPGMAVTGVPVSSTLMVIASFNTITGEPRSQAVEVALPMCCFCTVIPPVKNAEFKITITTNRPPPPLSTVFEDMMAQAPPGVQQSMAQASAAGGGAAMVMSFQMHGSGPDVTVLVSKAGGRYRIQSDALHALWLIVQELTSRLAKYYEEAEAGLPPPPEGPFRASFEEALPLQDFFEAAEAHFNARQALAGLKTELEARAAQFRNVEKRLLMRFKDKNPAPLNQLDVLMGESYEAVMDLGAKQAQAQAALRVAQAKLGGVTQLLLLVIRFKFGLSEAEAALLKSCIPPEVDDGPDVGWEECVEASMTHLLRTALAKNAKEQAVQVAPLSAAKDTQRLRKHVSLVLERLAKGMRLNDSTSTGALAAAGGLMA